MNHRNTRDTRPDEGTALILVLVLMVVGALIVLPLMDYAMSIGRANSVLSVKTARTEPSGGLRTRWPSRRGSTRPAGPRWDGRIPLTGRSRHPVVRQAITTAVVARIVPVSSAWRVRGQSVPSECPPGYCRPTPHRRAHGSPIPPEVGCNKIGCPTFPVTTVARSPLGLHMPAGFPECTSFPRYVHEPDPIDGPTYFASGIYDFEDVVRIQGSLVRRPPRTGRRWWGRRGCAPTRTPLYASMRRRPTTSTVSGLRFVADAGRLVVATSRRAIHVDSTALRFRQRPGSGRRPTGRSLATATRQRRTTVRPADPGRARSAAVARWSGDRPASRLATTQRPASTPVPTGADGARSRQRRSRRIPEPMQFLGRACNGGSQITGTSCGWRLSSPPTPRVRR